MGAAGGYDVDQFDMGVVDIRSGCHGQQVPGTDLIGLRNLKTCLQRALGRSGDTSVFDSILALGHRIKQSRETLRLRRYWLLPIPLCISFLIVSVRLPDL